MKNPSPELSVPMPFSLFGPPPACCRRHPIDLIRFAKKFLCDFYKLPSGPVVRAFACHSEASKRRNAQVFAIH
jgi:hypothetical protein